MSLENDIRAWDGKSAVEIGRVFDTHASDARFAARLIELSSDGELERGGTWLLKKGLETRSFELSAAERAGFFALFSSVKDWGAGLHLMQCLPMVPLPKKGTRPISNFLDRQLTDRRSIVRAWAYWGYHELALVNPRFREEAESLLLDAAKSESSGAVKVRVRKALEARGLA